MTLDKQKFSEKNLITQVLNGDQLAIKTLYERFSFSLYSLISSKVKNKEDIDEILQETWISILESLPLFNFRCPFIIWAKKIALHEIADFYRKQKIKSIVFSRLPFLESLVSQALGPEFDYQKKEIKEEMEKVFSSLSEGYREILRLKYIEGLSLKEIAEKLGVSFKSLESRLFRARMAFQSKWKERFSNNLSALSSSLPLKRYI